MLELKKLEKEEWDDFIKRNQEAFQKAVIENFKDYEGEVISKEDIIKTLITPSVEAFNIYYENKKIGGVVVQINDETQCNSLDLLFVEPNTHGKNIGYRVWEMIEKKYPKTKVWETYTPHFEIRNIHFYVNKCGFKIVEFFNEKHPMEHHPDFPEGDLFFRFEKVME